MSTYRFLIADDHPLFRTAIRETLLHLHADADILEAQDSDSLLRSLEDQTDIDLVLLDLNMPGARGFSTLIYLGSHHPEIPVLMISAFDTDDIISRAIGHGAAGFLSKSSDISTIANAVSAVLAGNVWVPASTDLSATKNNDDHDLAQRLATLTPQQFRVATMLSEGLLNKQIAYEMHVTEATIKAHITEIFRKLGVHSRTQAVLMLSRLEANPPAPV